MNNYSTYEKYSPYKYVIFSILFNFPLNKKQRYYRKYLFNYFILPQYWKLMKLCKELKNVKKKKICMEKVAGEQDLALQQHFP